MVEEAKDFVVCFKRKYPQLRISAEENYYVVNDGDRSLTLVSSVVTGVCTDIAGLLVDIDSMTKREIAAISSHVSYLLYGRFQDSECEFAEIVLDLPVPKLKAVENFIRHVLITTYEKGSCTPVLETVLCPRVVEPSVVKQDIICDVKLKMEQVLTILCSRCKKAQSHKIVKKAIICPCGNITRIEGSKKNRAYYSGLSLRYYIASTMEKRVSDLFGILSNLDAQRVLAPADCIGFAQMAGKIANVKVLSCDTSEECVDLGVDVVKKDAFALISEYVKGDVVLVSHCEALVPGLINKIREEGMRYVIYEPSTMLFDRVGWVPIPTVPGLMISDRDLWKGIPIDLSMPNQRKKFDVLTNCFSEGSVYYAADTSSLRTLEYLSLTGRKVKLSKSCVPPNLLTRLSCELVADTPNYVVYKKNLVIMDNCQYYDLGRATHYTSFPYKIYSGLLSNAVSSNMLVPLDRDRFTYEGMRTFKLCIPGTTDIREVGVTYASAKICGSFEDQPDERLLGLRRFELRLTAQGSDKNTYSPEMQAVRNYVFNVKWYKDMFNRFKSNNNVVCDIGVKVVEGSVIGQIGRKRSESYEGLRIVRDVVPSV